MYYQFTDEEGNQYGSFEVWKEYQGNPAWLSDHNYKADKLGPGWYWWACFPGCMPDGDPSGPFETEQEAINDAQSV